MSPPQRARRRRIAVLQDVRHRRHLPTPPGGWPLGPPRGRSSAPFLAHADLFAALRRLGYQPVRVLLDGGPRALAAVARVRATAFFNLVESYAGDDTKDLHVAAYLELLGRAYTGNGPRALHLGQNKPLAKKVLQFHGVPTPPFFTVAPGEPCRRRLPFPLIVKPAAEDGSLGIDSGSLVEDDRRLVERVGYLQRTFPGEVLVESYVAGREILASVLGGERPEVLPLVELDFSSLPPEMPRIAGCETKWAGPSSALQVSYRCPADLGARARRRIEGAALAAWHALGMRDYARIDLRLDADGGVHVLEANPNPCISESDGAFALSAAVGGRRYHQLIGLLVRLALDRR